MIKICYLKCQYPQFVLAVVFSMLYACSGSDSSSKIPPIFAQPPNGQPAKPTDVSVQSGDGQNSITWKTVDGATQYIIEWSLDNTFSSVKSDTVMAPATQYIHTGLTNGQAVYYRINASNSAGGSPPSDSVSGTPAAGLPNNQTPVIQQGASVDITMDEDSVPQAFNLTLNASDTDSNPLVWRISVNAINGTAAVISANTLVTVSYTPTLNYYGADNFTIEVDDNNGGLASIQVNVTINPVNDAPILQSNNLALLAGENITFQSGNLSANDIDNDDTLLTFITSGVTHGQFELGTALGIPITNFTQAQVAAGDVHFVHDGSATAPSYTVTVSDGTANNIEGPVNAIVNFYYLRPLIIDALTNITDTSLVNCIQRIALDKQLVYVDELTQLLCDQIAVDGSITDLSGVESFYDITLVNIPFNDIADITPLTLLKFLQGVRLEFNLIADMTVLTQFSPTLVELTLANNLLTDASFANVNLAQLSSLGIIQIDVSNNVVPCAPPKCNNITDLSVFSSISSLTTVYFRNNVVTSLAPLAQLPNLKQIDGTGNLINNAGVTAFNQPGTFPSLQQLFLYANKIDDVADIALGLNGEILNYLILDNNPIGEFNTNPPVGSTGGGSIALLIPSNITTTPDPASGILGIGYPKLSLSGNQSIPCVLLQSLIDDYAAKNQLTKLWPQTAVAPVNCK